MNNQSVLSARSLWSRLWRSRQRKLKLVHLKLIDPSGQLPICSFQRSSLLEILSMPHRSSDEYSWNKLVSQVRKKVLRTWTSPREENGCCYEKFKCTNKSELEINKQNNQEHRKPTCPPNPAVFAFSLCLPLRTCIEPWQVHSTPSRWMEIIVYF